MGRAKLSSFAARPHARMHARTPTCTHARTLARKLARKEASKQAPTEPQTFHSTQRLSRSSFHCLTMAYTKGLVTQWSGRKCRRLRYISGEKSSMIWRMLGAPPPILLPFTDSSKGRNPHIHMDNALQSRGFFRDLFLGTLLLISMLLQRLAKPFHEAIQEEMTLGSMKKP